MAHVCTAYEADTHDATVNVALETTIEADETYICHLFRNLFANAVKHGSPGATIMVGNLPDGVYVVNDGPGIPAEEHDTVLEVGTQLRLTPAAPGVGLGIREQVGRQLRMDGDRDG